MVALPTDHRSQFTVEEYFALEAASETRHEYFHGEIIAMSGARRNHVMIAGNVHGELRAQLANRPDCGAFASDLRVRVAGKIYFYPDVVVACDEQYTDASQMTLINPCLVVEVTSESTAMYDRLTKLAAYRQMPSVQEILIVDQYRAGIEQHTRVPEGWLVRAFSSLEDVLTLDSIGCTLAVSGIYTKVELQA
ncbi:MAG: Uma2 family endonuclease [Anaerolineae bacterium]|nr:Uma2 family endonuclease [Anaerolineae bacterium]